MSFYDELKKIMDVDAEGNYSTFKPLPTVEETNSNQDMQAGINQYLDALQRQTKRQSQPMNVGLLDMQRGGGIIPITPVELESTERKMQGLLDLMAMVKGPQG